MACLFHFQLVPHGVARWRKGKGDFAACFSPFFFHPSFSPARFLPLPTFAALCVFGSPVGLSRSGSLIGRLREAGTQFSEELKAD
ncbi:hypothetical protein BRADI_1g68469v3 [Brachypodium distachyon]|uniref:Uncharacterized protein n=1 Tax=Brachypodium distachyon TaxID=15368 RepID=A0A0Q3SCC2_BRADI|nr:hypothetical protein BRADI_1g68469v3 [Brachypodium distachyon]